MFVNGIGKTLYAFRQIDVQILRPLELEPDEPERTEGGRRLISIGTTASVQRCGRVLFVLLVAFRVHVCQIDVLVALQVLYQVAYLGLYQTAPLEMVIRIARGHQQNDKVPIPETKRSR